LSLSPDPALKKKFEMACPASGGGRCVLFD
jgi:hypothetical protein